MDATLTVKDSFTPALLAAWAASRRGSKDLSRLINLAMRQWVSFAIHKIPKANRAAIKARLEARASRARFQHGIVRTTKTGRESKSARYQFLKESLAAYIVYATNYRTRRGSARAMSAAQFYAHVGRYIGARQFSAGYLKAGLYPALSEFKAARGEDTRPARYRQPAGTAVAARPEAPEARVADFASGILDVAPRAFLDSLGDVVTWIQRNIVQNLIERAREQKLRTA